MQCSDLSSIISGMITRRVHAAGWWFGFGEHGDLHVTAPWRGWSRGQSVNRRCMGRLPRFVFITWEGGQGLVDAQVVVISLTSSVIHDDLQG